MPESTYKLAKEHLFSVPQGMPMLGSELNSHAQNIHSALEQLIAKNNNFLPFAEYMQFCLYEPQLGYYSSGLQKFGQEGDFTTAPEISSLFGECIADAIAPLLKAHKEWSICEIGPGRGAFAEAIINRLDSLNTLPQSYQLLEVSASLSDLQRQRLDKFTHKLTIKHLQSPPKNFRGIFLGNEIIDALVVERFYIDQQGSPYQLGISCEKGKLIEVAREAPDYLKQAIGNLEVDVPRDYKSEICVQLKPWLDSIIKCSEEAVLLFSDYGFSQGEYYSPERTDGTLRCHYRQHAHNNALVLPGLQDITAWVDFTALGNAALELDLEVVAYSTQAHVLLGSERLQQINFEAMTELERFQTSKAIQTLSLPANMGERFRFMQLNKNCEAVIPAMQLRDLRHQL